MTQDEFTDAVMEALFVRGFACLDRPVLWTYVGMELAGLGASPDPMAYIETLWRVPGLVRQATDPELGIPATLAGAREEWIAVHEAAHAIVAVKAGIMVRGIRFYGDGLRGETGIEDLDWLESTDEQLLRRLVRLDVAGNVGEIIRGYEPKGGYLSRFFDDKDPAQPANYPSDVIAAWQQHARVSPRCNSRRRGKSPRSLGFALRNATSLQRRRPKPGWSCGRIRKRWRGSLRSCDADP